MNQIVPHTVWLGHAGDGCDFRRIFDLGIRAVVYLAAEEELPDLPRDLICCRFPLLDSPGNDPQVLCLAVNTIATLLKSRLPTLACCSSGLSRSPAVVAASLALVQQEPAEEWLQRIAQHHPTDVSPGLWNELVSRESHTP